MNVFERVREAWTVFRGRDRPMRVMEYTGPSSADRADRRRMSPGNERSLVNSAYNRMALDVAMVEIHHAITDENEFYKETVHDSLEELLTVEANLDQSAMAYTVDLVISMFDEGVVAEVPVVCEMVPYDPPDEEEEPMAQSLLDFRRHPEVISDDKAWMMPDGTIEEPGPGYRMEVSELRTAKIIEWKPRTVIVECYDERTGNKERFEVGKRLVCIHENPFYSVMNEKNSIFQRLVRKMNLQDAVDNNMNSDKLNALVQLPYIVRGDIKRNEANQRIKELERQLKESPHGLAWVDAAEKFTPLGKPIDNSLQGQIEWLTELFFSQLGITQEILNGTADEKAMTNYMSRTVGVVLEEICTERKRKLLTKEQRDHGESIVYVQDPLRLIPATSLADIFDKLGRNAILSPNECRGTLGYKPSEDPSANQLGNRNMPVADTPEGAEGAPPDIPMEAQHSALPPGRRKARGR